MLFLGLAIAAPAAPVAVRPSIQGSPFQLGILVNSDTLSNRGEISETIHANRYTYLRVAWEGQETWLAVPRIEIEVGTRIRYGAGTPMKDFFSPTLKRTFTEVLFLQGIEIDGE